MKNSNGLVATSVADGHSKTNGHGKKEGYNSKATEDSREASRRKIRDDGFEEWGGYMAAKKAKLDVQFNASSEIVSTSGLGMFHGLCIYINGYTDPPEPQLREMFILHGGAFSPYNSAKINFVVATNLSAPSKNLYASKTVKPEWITESIAAGTKLDPRKYLLYNLNEEKNQHTLTQFMDKNTSTASAVHPVEHNGSARTPHLSNGHSEIYKANGSKHNGNQGNCDLTDDLRSADDPSDFPEASDDELGSSRQSKTGCKQLSEPTFTNGRQKVKMATEDGFLEEFFRNSRLHLISDQKKEMLNKIGQMRKDLSVHEFHNLEVFEKEVMDRITTSCSLDNNSLNESSDTVILMHIDLDCFFVSVGLLSRPHLRGKPTVVTHSTGKEGNSRSDIASASYEARKFGIRNGMWVSGAKELCPNLEVIPYDFEEYRRVSELFFDTVASITLDIEPCSVDEMVVNVTSILKRIPGSTPQNLANFIRQKIFEATKCPASIGIGSNRLLSKLATKKAKPNGVYYLEDSQAQNFIRDLKVGELPGIGHSHEAKLSELLGVKTCKELLQVPMKDLKKNFGDKTAEKMLQSCQGKDTAELKYGFDRPKSISVDVNYGIRFTKDDEIVDFMIKLCQELASRATKAQASSSHLAVRILVRRKGAGDPKKHGGHGIVDSINKSSNFLQPTRDWQDMFKASTRLLRLLPIPPTDYRGIGLSLTDLRFDFDQSNNQKNSIQTTLFDLTTSRGRKMVEFATKAAGTKVESSEESSPHEDVSEGRCSLNGMKRRTSGCKTDLKIDITPPKAKKKTIVNGEVPALMDDGDKVDINVLRELPKDIAREMALHYGIDVADLEDDTDWLEGEELLRDAPLVSPCVGTVEHNDKGVSATEETIESVIRQSVADNSNKAVNPYENVDTIDPSFLSALPDSIRNEVLMQFQEAKGRIDENKISVGNEPQPCSSKQALERDRAFNHVNTNKKPIQSTNPCYKVPIEERSEIMDHNDLPHINLSCHEDMCQEEELVIPVTPPPFSSPTCIRTQSPKHNWDTIKKLTPRSSKKRLDFGDNHSRDLANKDHISDWNEFWDPSPMFQIPVIPFEPIDLPALNGNTNIENIRNQIRGALDTVHEPFDEDVACLRKYFDELISRGWLEQSRTLLRFIHRKSLELPAESGWSKVFTEIIETTQKSCRQLFGHIICLD